MEFMKGFQDSTIGRKQRKTMQPQNKMLLYGIIGVASILFLILIITIFSKSSQISTYTEENERLRSDISAKEAQRRTLSDETNNLQKEKDKLEMDNKAKTQQVAELENKNKELTKQKNDANGLIGEMNDELSIRERQLAIVLEQKQDLDNKLGKYPMTSDEFDRRRIELKATIRVLENKLKEIESSGGLIGGAGGSSILSQSDFDLISSWIGPINFKYNLVYKMSRDGRTPQAFHQKCDRLNQNVIVIQTKGGEVFGGFTNNGWGNEGFTRDEGAFVFNIKNKKKWNVSRPNNAIFSESKYLFVFGRGDIMVSEGQSYSEFPDSYGADQARSGELTGNEMMFEIKEIEVFSLDR